MVCVYVRSDYLFHISHFVNFDVGERSLINTFYNEYSKPLSCAIMSHVDKGMCQIKNTNN